MSVENSVNNTLTESQVQDHYDQLAELYDQFHDSDAVVNLAMEYLTLQPDDWVADVGGGTGAIAQLLYKKVGLKNPVLVVDPSAKMLEVAKKKEGVATMLATVDEFLASSLAPKYNKILMAGCVHHFPDMSTVFKTMRDVMPNDGTFLILEYGYTSDVANVPLFQAALNIKLPGLSRQQMPSVLSEVGFSVSSVERPTRFKCSKDKWYSKIRNRFLSALSTFTDVEIEAGITELENSVLKAKKVVEYDLHFYVVTGIKQS